MKRRYPIAGFGALTLAFGGLAFPGADHTEARSCAPGPAAAVDSSQPSIADRTVLGMEWHGGRPYLAELDARTLRSQGDSEFRVSTVATVSPDQTGFVTALGGDYVPDGGDMRLKFVDLPHMRVDAEVPLGAGGGVHSVHWFDDNRLIVVVGQPARVFIVDTETDQLLEEIPLRVDEVFEVRRAADSVVVLTSAQSGSSHPSESKVSPTRLHVVSTSGELRSTDVLDVDAGYEFDPDLGGRHRYPGLAVDERGSRAFIVDSLQRVAEVELSSMGVAYRAVGARVSLWTRLLSFFGNVAEAKLSTGPSMHAHFVPNGSILVGGVNEGIRRSPVHMTLINTNTWEACRLDTNMSDAAVGDDVIVTWDSIVRLGQGRSERTLSSSGVTAYDLQGRKRFEVLQETPICWLDLVGHTAYAYKCGRGAAVIDVANGDVRHIRAGRPIQLITGDMTF
jgi:hypothetical protein